MTEVRWQPGNTLEDIEREVILAALRFYHGNRTRAADSLGIAIRTMTNKVTKYKEQGVAVPEYIPMMSHGMATPV